MTPQQERDVLEKAIELIEDLTGKKPVGNVAPWWEVSATTNELLLEYGYKYDHSLQHNDFTPYYARKGDSWTAIRLLKAGCGVDEAARAGRGDRPGQNPPATGTSTTCPR